MKPIYKQYNLFFLQVWALSHHYGLDYNHIPTPHHKYILNILVFFFFLNGMYFTGIGIIRTSV